MFWVGPTSDTHYDKIDWVACGHSANYPRQAGVTPVSITYQSVCIFRPRIETTLWSGRMVDQNQKVQTEQGQGLWQGRSPKSKHVSNVARTSPTGNRRAFIALLSGAHSAYRFPHVIWLFNNVFMGGNKVGWHLASCVVVLRNQPLSAGLATLSSKPHGPNIFNLCLGFLKRTKKNKKDVSINISIWLFFSPEEKKKIALSPIKESKGSLPAHMSKQNSVKPCCLPTLPHPPLYFWSTIFPGTH